MSVIIVSYNEAEYLPEAIESCLSQSLKNIEIIIGDDGSDDGSIELIRRYCSEYPGKISYFVMDRPIDTSKTLVPPIRVSNVVKTALAKAKGKYIVVLSGDDYFCSNEKFDDAVAFLDSHRIYTAYADGFKTVYEDGQEVMHSAYGFRRFPVNVFWSGYYIHLSSFVWRKSVFDDGFFLERICDDTGLIFSIACAGKIMFSDKIAFVYRQHKGSIMSNFDKISFSLCELILFQDCLNSGKMIWSSYSRYCIPLKFIYANRSQLHDEAYSRYIKLCENYPNNVIGCIVDSDSSLKNKVIIHTLILRAVMAKHFFNTTVKIINLPGRIIRKLRKIYQKFMG